MCAYVSARECYDTALSINVHHSWAFLSTWLLDWSRKPHNRIMWAGALWVPAYTKRLPCELVGVTKQLWSDIDARDVWNDSITSTDRIVYPFIWHQCLCTMKSWSMAMSQYLEYVSINSLAQVLVQVLVGCSNNQSYSIGSVVTSRPSRCELQDVQSQTVCQYVYKNTGLNENRTWIAMLHIQWLNHSATVVPFVKRAKTLAFIYPGP